MESDFFFGSSLGVSEYADKVRVKRLMCVKASKMAEDLFLFRYEFEFD